MLIKKKHIRNPIQYLYEFGPDEGIYISAPVSDEDILALSSYGFDMVCKESQQTIPVPRRNATKLNADGRWLIHRDQPKVDRTFEHEYHIVDWHGNDHYGTCFQTRKCYQRTLIPPRELVFTLENSVLLSPLFHNSDDYMDDVKLAINVLLEILGRCETWTAAKAPAVPPVKQRLVSWEVLRSGSRRKEEWEQYVDETTRVIPRVQRQIIRNRHEFLWNQQPDFCVLGSQNFWGYVVYGFTLKDLYIFECNKPDNATYVFRGNWEEASKLTKTEILDGHIQEARLLHTEKWRGNLGKLIAAWNKEIA